MLRSIILVARHLCRTWRVQSKGRLHRWFPSGGVASRRSQRGRVCRAGRAKNVTAAIGRDGTRCRNNVASDGRGTVTAVSTYGHHNGHYDNHQNEAKANGGPFPLPSPRRLLLSWSPWNNLVGKTLRWCFNSVVHHDESDPPVFSLSIEQPRETLQSGQCVWAMENDLCVCEWNEIIVMPDAYHPV